MSNGIGFFGFLTLIFIGLKLVGVGVVAGWSWGAVLAPIWIPVAISLVLLIVWAFAHAAVKTWRQR